MQNASARLDRNLPTPLTILYRYSAISPLVLTETLPKPCRNLVAKTLRPQPCRARHAASPPQQIGCIRQRCTNRPEHSALRHERKKAATRKSRLHMETYSCPINDNARRAMTLLGYENVRIEVSQSGRVKQDNRPVQAYQPLPAGTTSSGTLPSSTSPITWSSTSSARSSCSLVMTSGGWKRRMEFAMVIMTTPSS